MLYVRTWSRTFFGFTVMLKEFFLHSNIHEALTNVCSRFQALLNIIIICLDCCGMLQSQCRHSPQARFNIYEVTDQLQV
jgi:hypothetical protein